MPTASSRVPIVDPTRAKGVVERSAEQVAKTRAIAWFLIHIGSRVDPVLMRLSSGRVNVTGTDSVVVLTHTGAKSGTVRHTPLVYFTDGPNVILIASKGGAATSPAWYFNLVANPYIELHVGREGGAYRATPAVGAERDRLWSLALRLYSGYADYQSRAGGREIPVVVCAPLD